MILGRGVSVPSTIANVQELFDDENDSIATITDAMSTMQMASNVNTQSVNVGINKCNRRWQL